jgi:hypothetical protein
MKIMSEANSTPVMPAHAGIQLDPGMSRGDEERKYAARTTKPSHRMV